MAVEHEQAGADEGDGDLHAEASGVQGSEAAQTTLRRGMPFGASEATGSDSVVWIDEVNGGPIGGSFSCTIADRRLRVRGWFLGDPERGGRTDEGAYLILSDGTNAWHALIPERQRRPDVMRGMLARDRRSRRIIRAIDLLPPSVGRQILRIWAGGRDRFGFAADVDLAGLPPGRYALSLSDMTASGRHIARGELVLVVTA
jgi:hypothetical protein